MKTPALILSFVIVAATSQAQLAEDSTKIRPGNNSIANLWGDISIISIGYERLFFTSPTSFLAGKVGIGYSEELQLCLFGPCTSVPEKYFTFTHHFSFNFGNGKHFFEAGVGGTYANGINKNFYFLYPLAGYRLQPLHRVVGFRIYMNIPLSGIHNADIPISPIGANLLVNF